MGYTMKGSRDRPGSEQGNTKSSDQEQTLDGARRYWERATGPGTDQVSEPGTPGKKTDQDQECGKTESRSRLDQNQNQTCALFVDSYNHASHHTIDKSLSLCYYFKALFTWLYYGFIWLPRCTEP